MKSHSVGKLGGEDRGISCSRVAESGCSLWWVLVAIVSRLPPYLIGSLPLDDSVQVGPFHLLSYTISICCLVSSNILAACFCNLADAEYSLVCNSQM